MMKLAIFYLSVIAATVSGELVVNGEWNEITRAQAGDSVLLSCTTNYSEPVDLYYYGQLGVYRQYVISRGEVTQATQQKRYPPIEVQSNESGSFVMIHSVQPSDSGWYECVEDTGLGRRRWTHLKILKDEEFVTKPPKEQVTAASNTDVEKTKYSQALVIVLSILAVLLILVFIYSAMLTLYVTHLRKKQKPQSKDVIGLVDRQGDVEAGDAKDDEGEESEGLLSKIEANGTDASPVSNLEFEVSTDHNCRAIVELDNYQVSVVKCAELLATSNVGSDKIHGITILDDEMYVVCVDQNKVSVFQSCAPFTKRRAFVLECARSLRDIVACPEEDCLFISDMHESRRGTVWRVSRDGTILGEVLSGADNPVTLSCINKELIISNGRKVDVYSLEQRSVEKSPMAPPLELYHAVMSRDGDFFTSSGAKTTFFRLDNPPQLINKFKRTGFGEAVFGDKKADELQNLDEPTHMAFSSRGNLLVADRNHQQVLMISQDLASSCRLISLKGSYKPVRLYFDQTSKRLFVGMSGGEKLRIDVYEIVE